MRSTLQTLLYHRIGAPHASCPDLAPDLISGTPRTLERHLRYLALYRSPVGPDEVIAAIGGTHVLPPGAVLVTFDDGYRDSLRLRGRC